MTARLPALALTALLVCGIGAAPAAAAQTPAGAVATQAPAGTVVTQAPADSAVTAPGDDGGPAGLLILLDTSGSMSNADASGTRRIEGAKAGIIGLVNTLPAGVSTRIGLQTYPSGGDCGEPKVVADVAPLDVSAFTAAVAALPNPTGGTPTAVALRKAAESLRSAGYDHATIVLVSDGEANCSADPCEAAREIVASGLTLTVNTVGFNISSSGRQQLECIADATGGDYYDVSDAQQLGVAMEQAVRPRLSLDVTTPPGSIPSTTKSVTVTITAANTGSVDAEAVRVSLVAAPSTDTGGIAVLQPVRLLGRFTPGHSQTVAFTVSVPIAPTSVQHLTARLTASNAAVAEREVTLTFGDLEEVTAQPDSAFYGMTKALVLGDSYSSGEGAATGDRPYMEGPTGKDGCHRSQNQYANWLFKPENVTILACSGAVIEDFDENPDTGTAASANKKEDDQITRLRALLATGYQPDVVFLTLGGNDVGFGSIIQSCTQSERTAPGTQCFINPKSDMYPVAKESVETNAQRLPYTYQKIGQAFVDGHHAVPPIVVLPYPIIVPLNPTTRGSCRPGVTFQDSLSPENMDAVVAFQLVLNRSIEWAVDSARARWDMPIYYASDVAWAVQPDHTVCQDDAWINRITRHLSDQVEFLHPNKLGHQAMALELARWGYDQAGQVVGADTILGRFDYKDSPYQDFDYDNPRVIPVDVGATSASSSPVEVHPGTASVSVHDLDPDSPVVLYAKSDTYPVGSGWADEHGEFSASFALDLGRFPYGSHTVMAAGIRDGQAVLLSTPLVVTEPVPAAWWWALYGSGGLLIIGLGLLGIRAIRMRRDRARM